MKKLLMQAIATALTAYSFTSARVYADNELGGSSGKTAAWWRFTGTPGTTPTTIAPFAGTTKSLTVTKMNTSLSPAVKYDARSAGNGIVTNRETGAAIAASEAGVGSLHVPVQVGGSNSTKLICDDSSSSIIGILPGNDTDAESFTAEIVFRVDSWGTGLGKLVEFDSTVDPVKMPLYIQPGGNKSWQIRCDRQIGNESKANFTADIQDGKWHHLAVTYDPATTNVCVWFDQSRKLSYKPKYPLVKVTKLIFLGSYFDGQVEDIRISRGVLPTSEFLTHVSENPADFFLPLNDAAYNGTLTPFDLRAAERTDVSVYFLATSVKGAYAGAHRYLYDAAGLPYAISYVAGFTAASALKTDACAPAFLEKKAFTLEAFVKPTAPTGAYDIFSHDGVWTLGADAENRLKWTCGENEVVWSDAVVSLKSWHHVAIVSKPEDGTVTAYLDGVAAGTVADVVFPKVTGSLALGRGLIGSAYGFRASPKALAPEEFLRQSPARDLPGNTLARWTFDAPGQEGEIVPGTAADALKSDDGLPNWDVYGYNYKGGVLRTKESTPAADQWFSPRFTNDVPNRCTWDAATGRIINPENATAVRLTHGNLDNVGGGDGSLLRIPTGQAGMPAEYTVELFARLFRKINCCSAVNMAKAQGAQWMLDTNLTTGKPRMRLDLVNGGNTTFGWGGDLTDGWHHLAVQVLTNETGNAKVVCYFDYVKKAENSYSKAWAEDADYVLNLGTVCGAAWDGCVDELRITAGALDPSHFMRAFTPRADLQALWLTDGLVATEVYSGTNYLTGAFAGGVAASGEVPHGTARFISKKRKFAVRQSVAFDGTGSFTVPCAAFAGMTNFTVEATVRGAGCVFAKRRFLNGDSWRVATDADGKAAVELDTFRAGALRDFDPATVSSVSATVLADKRWHHVAFTADRTGGVGTLYVDGTAAAEISLADMRLDAGDLVVGDGFKGEMLGLRLTPAVLDPDEFMLPLRPRGLVLFLK